MTDKKKYGTPSQTIFITWVKKNLKRQWLDNREMRREKEQFTSDTTITIFKKLHL